MTSGGGGIQIKSEPVGIIREGYRNNRARGRASYQGRGSNRGRNFPNNNKCYNCDQQNFTREHLDRCPAKGVTCNFCHKIGHFQRTCRGKRGNQRGQGAVGMIRENVDDGHLENSADEEASQHASSIGWVNKNPVVRSWDSSSSEKDYMVMAIKHKRVTELKVAGAQLPIKVNGKPTRVWIDSGSPISIFTIGELCKTLGTSGVKLDNLTEDDNAFRDYGNNPFHITDDWNNGGNNTIKRLEDTREDKSNWREPTINNRKRSDAPIRTPVGATITRGTDNVH